MALNAALRTASSASSRVVNKPTRLPPLPSIKEIVKLYKLKAIKQLSQNFLLDEKLTGKIVKAAGRLEDCFVCEVGPGPGGITRSIINKNPSKVILIEKDKRFANALELLRSSAPGMIELYWGDVLSFEMSKMFPPEAARDWEDAVPPVHIIGNLPFSVSTPLIVKWLCAMSQRSNAWVFGRVPLTLTFQLEVAQRLVAEVGNEQRSRLSIMAQHLCYCHHKFTIPGTAFVPKPDVDVGVVKFVPRKFPLIHQEFYLVEKLVRSAFSMRQKYCRRGVSTLFPESIRLHFTNELFQRAKVISRTRPFNLDMNDFSNLCNAYAEICKEYPPLESYNYRGFRPDEEWEEKHGYKFMSFKSDKKRLSSMDLEDDNEVAVPNEESDEDNL